MFNEEISSTSKMVIFQYLRFFKEKEAAMFTDEFSQNISETILTFNGLFCPPPPFLKRIIIYTINKTFI